MANRKAFYTVVGGEAMPKGSESRQPHVTIEIFVGDDDFPENVISEPVPQEFPREHISELASFMSKGFNAAIANWPRLTRKAHGRPLSPEVQRIGQEAAKLRMDGLTYGQIALQLCPKRKKSRHKCNKACADRIRQAAKIYLA